MSGHSKWSSIKHKKAATDAKRGKAFTKLIKEITVAARMGGGDINANPRLRTAVTTARQQSMPKDNIDRAIKKGTGELEGVTFEELSYEGYGPGGVAIILDALTDNRNRLVSELRFIFSRHGGNLGENGSVGWMFKKHGIITIEKSATDEDKLMEIALDAGADDVLERRGKFRGDHRAGKAACGARRDREGRHRDRHGGDCADSGKHRCGFGTYGGAGTQVARSARGPR